jgi:uncharacterized membrane protein YeaQ/YmgE (transglycosylase-associated protein family)
LALSAFVGGIIFTAVGGHRVTGFNRYIVFVAIIGAIVVPIRYHAVFGRRIY